MDFFIDFSVMGSSLLSVLQPINLLWILIGTVVGIIFGAVPGLTATTAVALFTPITFDLNFTASFAFLLGIYCGGYYAGSIPAILINTPGAPGNAATALDGHTLAKKGLAGKALSLSVTSSWFGGVFSAICLLFFAPVFTAMALKFGPQEYFSVAVLGFSAIASISGKSMTKGLAAGMIGCALGCIGMDSIDGVPRFTFGFIDLMGGIDILPALIGLFALTEVFSKTESLVRGQKDELLKAVRVLPKFKEYWKRKGLLLKSSMIGTIVGAVPGTGPAIAAWLSYNEAKRSSKHPEEFGNGSEEGIVACEAANNAVTGGALIPLITLGIPGDAVTAVLLSALLIQGLTPGPMMIVNHYDIVTTMLWILLIANGLMLVFGLFGSKWFSKILSIPTPVLVPIICVLCVAGGFSVNNSTFDAALALMLGIIGYAFMKFGFPVAPMVLGMVLGPIIEPYFRLALIGSDMNPLIFVTSPLSCIFLILTVILTWSMQRRSKSKAKKAKAEKKP